MELRPFRGWRYADADLTRLIAPPYDILTAADKAELVSGSERNIVAVDMPHVPPKEVGPDSEYVGAADLLTHWKTVGVMRQDALPALYAYRQTYAWAGKTYRRRAILACVRATALGQDVIPHEHTFAGPKADRLKLMELTRMQLSPIFGFYEGADAAKALWSAATGNPDACGTLRGVKEECWAVTDPKAIAGVAAALASKPVYIADGHHRYTTALNYRDQLAGTRALRPEHAANFVMFALVEASDPGLLILPTHRILRGLRADFSLDKLRGAAGEFDWRSAPLDAKALTDADAMLRQFGPGAMAFIAAREDRIWIAALRDAKAMGAAKPDEMPAWRKLDVAVLHTLIIDKALAPWRTDATTIDYTPDGPAVADACRQGAPLGVCIQGTPLSAVREVAAAGGYMPHKSTYFYPKLATGVVLNPLE